MGLAIYVHIPYCLQRCRYCDFTTFEAHQIMPPEDYLELVLAEIRNRHQHLTTRTLDSVYFGGGTPSLVPAEHIVAILNELANVGFKSGPHTEVTVEINPATVDPRKLELYLKNGVNRFSVGAQTFNDNLLALCGRKHNASDTRQTLKLLDSHHVNYSFDLLFALPGQTMAGLQADLDEVATFKPRHLSAYCLTVPEGHPMASNRPLEEDQIKMFDQIESELLKVNIKKYEISNFAQPGYESRHNQTYWNDKPYWGLGLSAHSYLPVGPWGTRFWNPKTWPEYVAQAHLPFSAAKNLPEFLPVGQKEQLDVHESLSDFCHMFLRTDVGLNLSAMRNKYGPRSDLLVPRLQRLLERGFLTQTGEQISLSRHGQLLSNQVYAELLVTKEDWALPQTPTLA